jgi:hypothetical protein
VTGPFDPGARPALVFSHPNHELAVFGLVQRTRPCCIFLTDGGGPEREAETRAGLARVGIEERACFLGHREDDLYRALVERDLPFLQELGSQLRKELEHCEPSHVLCDAVELYNPVHDLALPLVGFATRGALPAFEIPLVYQRPGPGERYEVQRLPAERPGPRLRLSLTPAELEAKLAARDEVYGLLRTQLGPLLLRPAEHFAEEEMAPARDPLAAIGDGRAPRYERRGEWLRARGQVTTVITHAGHYAPLARALMEAG